MPQITTAIRSQPGVHLVAVMLAAIVLTVNGCERNPSVSGARTHVAGSSPVVQPAATSDGPLLLEDEPLLLLDDEPTAAAADKPAADNSRCFVCHANYLDEKIAVTHAHAGIGCAKCHGPSDAHIADESWASGGNGTAPEIMYPKDQINPSCMACHPKSTIDTADHKPLFAESPAPKTCTDCHGNHRLPIRRSKWK